jgi:hypothetical protein
VAFLWFSFEAKWVCNGRPGCVGNVVRFASGVQWSSSVSIDLKRILSVFLAAYGSASRAHNSVSGSDNFGSSRWIYSPVHLRTMNIVPAAQFTVQFRAQSLVAQVKDTFGQRSRQCCGGWSAELSSSLSPVRSERDSLNPDRSSTNVAQMTSDARHAVFTDCEQLREFCSSRTAQRPAAVQWTSLRTSSTYGWHFAGSRQRLSSTDQLDVRPSRLVGECQRLRLRCCRTYRLWNSLPADVTSATGLLKLHRKLKIHLFRQSHSNINFQFLSFSDCGPWSFLLTPL